MVAGLGGSTDDATSSRWPTPWAGGQGFGWVVTCYEINVLGFDYWWLAWVVTQWTPPVHAGTHPGWQFGFLTGLLSHARLALLVPFGGHVTLADAHCREITVSAP